MGGSLVGLKLGLYGPGNYVMTAGFFAAIYGTTISQVPPPAPPQLQPY